MCPSTIYPARLARIFHAHTRQDAAAVGIDGDFLYHEIGQPADTRAIPSHHLLSDDARGAFAAWKCKADRSLGQVSVKACGRGRLAFRQGYVTP